MPEHVEQPAPIPNDSVSPGCKNCYAEKVAARMQAMGQPNYRNGFRLRVQEFPA